MKQGQKLSLVAAVTGALSWQTFQRMHQIKKVPLGAFRIQNSKTDNYTKPYHTKRGSFIGWYDDAVTRVQGIRYASAERYAVSELYTYEDGNHLMIQPAPICAQQRSSFEEFYTGINFDEVEQTEFSQHLSITIPKDLAENEKVPVLVWIHGGSHSNGGIDFTAYDPQAIVEQYRVIVVSLTYRLGVLGYLFNRQGALANLGLLDQLNALKWIHENIAAFGGDTGQVTLYGESAGASSVRHLMIAQGSENLFQRVIIASDPFGTMYQREEMIHQLMTEFKQLPLDAPIEAVLSYQDQCLANLTERSDARKMVFAPQYGIYPLPSEAEYAQAWQEACSKIDVLVGATTREAAAFLITPKWLQVLGNMPLSRIVINQIIKQLSKRIFIKGSYAFARKYANHQRKMYHFLLKLGESKHLLGAGHTIDVALFFGKHPKNSPIFAGVPINQQQAAQQQLRIIFMEFVKGNTVPIWSDSYIEITAHSEQGADYV